MSITFGTPLEYVDTASFAASKTVNLATGAVVGDYRILQLVGLPNGTTPGVDSFSVDLPSGWTEIGTGTNSSAASDQFMRLCYRKFVGGDADTQLVNFTGGSLAIAAISVVVSGADDTTFLDVAVPAFNRPNANAQWQCPTITTVTDDAVVVRAIVGDGTVGSGMTDAANPSGHTLFGTQASTTPSNGWGMGMAYELQVTAGSAGTANWGTLNEEHAGATFAIRPAPAEGITSVDSTYGAASDELDFDDTNVDINGLAFGATIGASDVYLSPNDLLSEAGEVDITAAVNTWSATVINLDFSQLSQGTIDSLNTMGSGARFLIVNVGGVPATTEYFLPVALHRPQAFEMALSANFAPSITTSRMTGLSGTFAGGRIEEALNPSTTNTDVAADGHRVDVWNIQARPASREVSYDFRVLYGGVVSETITQTPQVTVSGADLNVSELPSATLTVTANVPQAVATENQISQLATVALTVTANAPTTEAFQSDESVLPSATLTVTGNVPQAVATENHYSELPPLLMFLTPANPQAVTTENHFSVLPGGGGALTLTPNAPQAVTTENHFAQIDNAGEGVDLFLVVFAPQAVTTEGTGDHISELPSATLTLTTIDTEPQAVTTENNICSMATASLSIVGNAPQAVTTESHISTLPSAAITVTANVPQAITSEGAAEFVNMAAAVLTLTPNAPQAVVGTVIRTVFNSNFLPTFGWNIYDVSTGSGTLIANMVDSQNAASGLSLSRSTGMAANSSTGNYADVGAGGLPAEFFDEWHANNVTESPTYTIGGLTEGDTYTLQLAGHGTGVVARTSNFEVTPANEGPQLYIPTGTSTPNPPVVFTGTVGSAGTIEITAAIDTDWWYINGFVLTVVKANGNISNLPSTTLTLTPNVPQAVTSEGAAEFVNMATATLTLTPNAPQVETTEVVRVTHNDGGVNLNDGQSDTPPSLTDGLAFHVHVAQDPAARTISTYTLGAQAYSQASGYAYPYADAEGNIQHLGHGYILDADIPTISSQLTITYSEAMDVEPEGFQFYFENVDQTSPVRPQSEHTLAEDIYAAAETGLVSTIDLNVEDGDYVVLIMFTGPSQAIVLGGDWNGQLERQWVPSSAEGRIYSDAITADDTNYQITITRTGGSGNGVIQAFVIKPPRAANFSTLPSAALTLAPNALQAVTTENHVSELASANITLTPNAPTVEIFDPQISQLATATLTITPNVPQAVTTEGADSDVSQLSAAALTLTPNVPQAVTTEATNPNTSQPPSASLTVTGNAPSAETTENHFSVLPSVVLTITANVPQAVTTEVADSNTSQLPSAPFTITANEITADTLTNDFELITSPNVATLGEATTAQLTPPGIKTTGDFTPGTLTEDQNPTGTVDVADEGYTEIEWVIRAKDSADADATYEFRVLVDGAVADTISETPLLTIVTDGRVQLPATDLTLTPYAITAVTQNEVQLPSAAITLTPNAPTFFTESPQTSLLAAADLTLTANVPTAVATELNYSTLPSVSLDLTAFAPQVATTELNYSVLPTAALTITVNVPIANVQQRHFAQVPSAALILTANVPTVVTTENKNSALPSADLTLVTYAPTFETFDLHTVTLPSASLVITPNVPTANVQQRHFAQVPSADLTLTTAAPTFETTELNYSVLPSADITLQGYGLQVVTQNEVQLPQTDLTLTPNVPQAATTELHYSVLPTQVLSLTTGQPTVLSTENRISFLTSANLTLTIYAPKFIAVGNEWEEFFGDPEVINLTEQYEMIHLGLEPDVIDLSDPYELILIRS